MMTGTGQFGEIEMGGMFTLIKVREGLARGDYRDPGHYRHPKGSVAYEWTGELPPAPQAPGMPALAPARGKPVDVHRGGGHEHH
jgi:hypothetical protein